MAELSTTDPVSPEDIRDTVRERYAAAARAMSEPRAESGSGCCGSASSSEQAGDSGSGCCSPAAALTSPGGEQVFGGVLYEQDDAEGAPQAAVDASLGCGVPTAVAKLSEGETVLDLGSGAGADVLDIRPARGAHRQGDRP